MSDIMRVQPFNVLLHWILKEFEENQSIFGIHRSLFYTPKADSPYAIEDVFGHYLATPIGPAAGPHTQLSQNIVSAWLSGCRFIELKTVQIMDKLEVGKPCIDMEDEGYNVEWSQELKLDQSTHEYINAWALIHVLRRLLGFEDSAPFGTIFNMSVGYDLAGVQSAPMTRFMDQMDDASDEIAKIQAILREQFPQFADVEIPTQLTNNVTLSTMHGCPPDEIERIARYLLEERGLHTAVKLNPTLLGKERVMTILHDDLGFDEIHIPDAVFEHDLKYERAVALIKSLKRVAAEQNLTFGVKLSNTLAMANHKRTLPGDEMYMSGRALYPITINLFHQLAQEFDGDLNVSYAGGADALNATTILAAGAWSVTSASDPLKPGGYSRFLQYLENLETEMRDRDIASLDELAQNKLVNLEQAAADALEKPHYKKSYYPYGLPKVESGLDLFDCVVAPCIEPCAVHQDVPEYAWLISQGKYDRALEVILARNPLPGVTGYVCTHLCQTRCTRNDYDEPVAIRVLKRIANEKGRVTMSAKAKSGHKVAIIGSGPSGLSAAAFLALNGIQATIFEAKDEVGGMLRLVPVFRLPWPIVQQDVDRITEMGVEIKCSHPITKPPEELLKDGFDAVYIASGFQKDTPLYIDGIEGKGVFTALDILERARCGEILDLGSKALVIGGGDTAMDATRVSQRFTGNPVTVVYRRTKKEMPASEEEREGAFEEGNLLEELVSPTKVILKDSADSSQSLNPTVIALACIRNKLGEPGADGRRRPVPIKGSEFQIETDSVVIAVGQSPDLTFLDGSTVSLYKNGAIEADPETGLAGSPHIYAGGDVVQGPDSIIAACADGRRAAKAICAEFGIQFEQLSSRPAELSEKEIIQVKRERTRKVAQYRPDMLPLAQRSGLDLIESTLTEDAARAEALRCVQCTTFCDKCVEVCPNRANYTFLISPVNLTLPTLICQNNKLTITGEENFRVNQVRQIIHVNNFCNECDNCATFCVHDGKPYRDKPRLFLDKGDFEQENDNAFYIEPNTIWRREGGQESQLLIQDDALTFENAHVRVNFTPDFTVQKTTLKEAFEGTLSLATAAEMAVIINGINDSLGFLILEHR
ncbi:MAG: putative selenate reductase subunit YgfK [Chloroflexi bacterium]|nr:putative selenate reductase subunit YgfK [Chloroflexota bacterium]